MYTQYISIISLAFDTAVLFLKLSIILPREVLRGSETLKPHSHCTLVPENCQKIAGVPSVWTQTRPGINSGIDPGLGPSNIAGFSPGTSAVWTKAGSMP